MRYDPPFHRTAGFRPVIVALALLVLLPFMATDTYVRHIFILAFIFAIVASSWDLSLGTGGMFNFAHVAMFAVGIYAYGLLTSQTAISPWLALPFAGLVAALVAAVITVPILRLSGIYIILVTVAASQVICQLVISQSEYTGGTNGLVGLPTLSLFGSRLTANGRLGFYYVALLALVASTIILYALNRSPFGRAVKAMRDHKYYAVSRGLSEGRVRLLTLMISAALAGFAGGLYAAYVRVASPDNFGMGLLSLILSILLLGGAGTLFGPILAAFLVTLLSEWLADYGAWRNILVSALVILILVFYPGGLWALTQTLRELADTWRAGLAATIERRFGRRRREARLLARERLIDTPHGLIAVADSGGDKPALLFIHGNSSRKEVFEKQFRHFSDRYRVIAFDLPGHGVSANADPEKDYNLDAFAAIAEAVLDELAVTAPVVFGWSLGGYVALELAARGRPLKGLAIAGTPPLALYPHDMGRAYDATSHFVLASKLLHAPIETRNFATSTAGPKTRESAHLHRAVWRTDGRARSYALGRLAIVDWPRQMALLREGKLPIAILNGSNDPFINHGYFRTLDVPALWRGAPQDIANGFHAPFLLMPEAFNAAFSAFLADLGYI